MKGRLSDDMFFVIDGLCVGKEETTMKASRPEQAVLTKDTGMSQTLATRSVIKGRVDGLNDHRIDDIWVIVDFPHVLAQPGVDCLGGHGCEVLGRPGSGSGSGSGLAQRRRWRVPR